MPHDVWKHAQHSDPKVQRTLNSPLLRSRRQRCERAVILQQGARLVVAVDALLVLDKRREPHGTPIGHVELCACVRIQVRERCEQGWACFFRTKQLPCWRLNCRRLGR